MLFDTLLKPVPQRFFLYCILGWIILNILLSNTFGVSIIFFNPFRLKLSHIRMGNSIQVRSVRYNIRKNRIVIDGLRLMKDTDQLTGTSSKRESTQKFNLHELRYKWWVLALVRIICSLRIVIEDMEVGDLRNKFLQLELALNGPRIVLTMHQQGAYLDDLCILESVFLRAEAEFHINEHFPFKDIMFEVKSTDMTLPLIQLLLGVGKYNAWKEDQKMTKKDQFGKIPSRSMRELLRERTVEEIISSLNRKLKNVYRYSSAIEKIVILFDSPRIMNVPFISDSKLVDIIRTLQLELSASSLLCSLSRSNYSDPGSKILFEKSERPFQLSCIASSLGVKFIHYDLSCKEKIEELKVCDVPSISLSGDTNLFSQKLDNSDFSALNNTVLKLVGHASSPIVDIDIEKLSILSSVNKNVRIIQEILSDMPIKRAPGLKEIVEVLKKRTVILEYFKHILPAVELKITIEDPTFLVSNKEDSLIHKLSILSIKTNSNKIDRTLKADSFYFLHHRLEIIDYTFYHQNKSKGLNQSIASLNNFLVRIKSRIYPSFGLCVNINLDSVVIDLTNIDTLRVINNTIRKKDEKLLFVEEVYFKKLAQEVERKLQEKVRQCNCMSTEETTVEFTELILQDLPYFFQYLKLEVNKFSGVVGARSVFIERSNYVDPKFETNRDFVSGELRRIMYSFENASVFLSRADNESSIDSPTSDSSKLIYDDFILNEEEIDPSCFYVPPEESTKWTMDVELSEFSTVLHSETKRNNMKMVSRPVCQINFIKFFTYPDSENKLLHSSLNFSNVDILWSTMSIFQFFSSIYNLKMIFSTDLYMHRAQCTSNKHKRILQSLKSRKLLSFNLKNFVEKWNLDCSTDYISCIMLLPNGIRTKLEIVEQLLTIESPGSIILTGHYVRLMVESPLVRNTWMRMIGIEEFKVATDLNRLGAVDNEPVFTLENNCWQWEIPHQFEMYKLFDNISTVFKSTKQMIHSLKTESNKSIMTPKVSMIKNIPKIRLKSKRWIFSVEDDPFEPKLNLILQLGIKEQKRRLEMFENFRKHAEEVLKKENVNPHIRRSLTISNFTPSIIRNEPPKRAATSFHMVELSDSQLEEAEHKVEKLKHDYDVLLNNISKSWIARVKKHRYLLKNHFKSNFSFLWGNIDPTKLPKDFNKNVLDFSGSPSLMTLIFEGIDIIISEPSFGIENIPNFIHDVGKGVPKDTKYSLMIPLHLDAKFTEIRCHLKDYPLPILHFPRDPSNPLKTSVELEGNLLIAEDMIHSEQELRTIYVPLVPSSHMEDLNNFYSLFVPRTLTAIKVFTDLNFNLLTSENARVVWGGSYSGAVQQTMMCFDNFSKPPIDPSPPIGFWDKIRNIFHARILIKAPSSGFEVAIKSDKSPYRIGGESAGYMLLFQDDVEIHCNENDDPKRFLSVGASKLYFGIPNFFSKPLMVWNMPSRDAFFFPDQEFSNLQENCAFYYLSSALRTKNYFEHCAAMSKAYVEKSLIKLTGGIEFNVGIMFERKAHNEEGRTFELTPHHHFRLCNPVYVKNLDKHDSYKGFRSDFIHLSFDLLSTSERAYNSLQVSPLAMSVFFKWWKSFSGNLPVRKGLLFGEHSISPKFGPHLYTISYKAEVFPLFISHTTAGIEATESLLENSKPVEVYGLKARMSKFTMDLHQRKEVFHEYKEKLDLVTRQTSLKFHEADVSCAEIDIRTLFGSFVREGYAKSSVPKIEVFDNDESWYDVEDFVEFGFENFHAFIPKVSIQPLLFSPLFIYKKLAPYGNKYQVDIESFEPITPFNNSKYHNCIFQKYVQLPVKLINEREQMFIKEKQNLEETIAVNEGDDSLFREQLRMVDKTLAQVCLLKSDVEFLNKEHKAAELTSEKPQISSVHLNFPTLDFLKSVDRSNRNYANKFIVISMLLKWNEQVRDIVLKYLHRITLGGDIRNITKLKTLRMMDALISGQLETVSNLGQHRRQVDTSMESTTSNTRMYDQMDPEELLSCFQEDIKELTGNINYNVLEKQCIQLIAPQVQFSTVKDPASCVIVTAPTIKVNSLSFDTNVSGNEYRSNRFLRRTGALLIKANVFVFHEQDQITNGSLVFDNSLYGATHDLSWRPWLGLELCFDPDILNEYMLISNFTAVFTYDQLLPFATISEDLRNSNILKNKMTCDFPRVVVKTNSARYLSLFNLATNLLQYVEPEGAKVKNNIAKMLLSLNLDDLTNLKHLIAIFEKQIDALKLIEGEYSYKKYILDDAEKSDLNIIRYNRYDVLMKLYMLMKVLTSASPKETNDDGTLYIIVKAKEIILHMLDDDGDNFLDLAVAGSVFQRIETTGGYNYNKASVDLAQVVNLQKSALLHDILSPLKENFAVGSEPFIEIEWEKDKAVGGIEVVKNVVSRMQSLKINVEQKTIENVIKWISPEYVTSLVGNSDEDDDDSSDESTESSSISDLHSSATTTYESSRDARKDSNPIKSPAETLFPMEEIIAQEGDIEEMIKRSKENMIIENIGIKPFMMNVTYQGTGAKRLINVTDFLIKFPEIRFSNQTMSMLDLMLNLKRILRRALLRHTGKFLGNKLKRHSRVKRLRTVAKSPLRQINNYRHYTNVEDLRLSSDNLNRVT